MAISESELSVDDLVLLGAELILSIFQKDSIDLIHGLVERGAPLWFQDEEGFSPLHAACFVHDFELVQYLIEKGAIWNAVDESGNTAADIALSFNDSKIYRIIRDAGIRSEFLIHLLESRAQQPDAINLQSIDHTAAGSTEAFMKTKLRYVKDENGQDICLAGLSNGEEVGVMMGWERGIMQETVKRLCTSSAQEGLSVLNVGFGLGVIDSLFQNLSIKPSLHVIIEPHPDVLAHMRSQGWYDKHNVVILEGKWQDFVQSEELLAFGGFDVIYTDTFSEDYTALKEFFDHVPDLLSGPESRFSFFNGLGATNPTFYDVYTNVAELHLKELGLHTTWYDVDVVPGDRWGKTREYFSLPIYRMPICSMAV